MALTNIHTIQFTPVYRLEGGEPSSSFSLEKKQNRNAAYLRAKCYHGTQREGKCALPSLQAHLTPYVKVYARTCNRENRDGVTQFSGDVVHFVYSNPTRANDDDFAAQITGGGSGVQDALYPDRGPLRLIPRVRLNSHTTGAQSAKIFQKHNSKWICLVPCNACWSMCTRSNMFFLAFAYRTSNHASLGFFTPTIVTTCRACRAHFTCRGWRVGHVALTNITHRVLSLTRLRQVRAFSKKKIEQKCAPSTQRFTHAPAAARTT